MSCLSNITTGVIIMIIVVLIYTTFKLYLSTEPLSLGTVFLEYIPMCFWSLVAYRLVKYDMVMSKANSPFERPEDTYTTWDEYQDPYA